MVKPPVGRFHESLWEIAENHLGNGLRYREIFEMNQGRPQPDGTRLTMASLIRPGWVLRMPRDAYGPGIEIVSPGTPGGAAGAAEQAGARQAQRATQAADGTPGTGSGVAQGSAAVPGAPASRAEQVGARQAERASHAAAGAPGPESGTRGPAALPGVPGAGPGGPGAPGGGPGGYRTALVPAQGPSGSALLSFPYELSAASLLAAGVLAALGRRRREQLWQRAFGKKVVMPGGDAALAEAALRLGASEPSARLLDTALRCLSQELAAQGKAPPTVFAAHLGQASLDLWIGPADKDPPRPWQSVDDGQVWRLPLAGAAGLDPDQAGAALAPYPGLVSIGTNDTGRMLIDLEVGARPDRRPRAAAHGAGRARRDGRRAGDQPVVGPDADHAGRLRARTGHARARADHRRIDTRRGDAGAGGQGRRSRARAGRAGRRFGAHRAIPRPAPGLVGAALPDHGGSAHAAAAGAAAGAGQQQAPDGDGLRGGRRRAGRDVVVGRQRAGAAARGRARLRPEGPAAAR